MGTGLKDLAGDLLQTQFEARFTTRANAATVVVTPDSATIDFGARLALTATVKDAAGNVLDVPVTWTSSDPAVLTVVFGGIVTTTGTGSALVIAAVDAVADTARVTVLPVSFVSVSAGSDHTCAVAARGAAYCWGKNNVGQLGTGNRVPSSTPRAVAGRLSFVAVEAGEQHTCGLTPVAYCWGSDASWALGQNGSGSANEPLPVIGLPSFAVMDAGPQRNCALDAAGAPFCWGRYDLSASTWIAFGGPVLVRGGQVFTSVTVGRNHNCGLRADGAAYCWGVNTYGQLGDGSHRGTVDTTFAVTVTPVIGGLAFRSIGGGAQHTCGVTTDGAAYCWGNSGMQRTYANGAPSGSLTPAPVAGDLRFVSVDAGSEHTCAIATSGLAYCWGENASGQLGDGTTSPSGVPVPLAGGSQFGRLSAGRAHTCGLTTTGIVYCWGDNTNGQLGDGTRNSRTTIVKVAGQP